MKAFKVRIATLYVLLCIIGFVNAEELHHKANINPSETFSNVEVYNNRGKRMVNAHVLSDVVPSPETVTTEAATKSVEDAIQAAEKAVQEIEKIIMEISDAKRNEEITINEKKNRANDANKKALEKGKAHEKAVKEFLDEVKSASDEADKKAVSALEKLTKAETDAQNAKKEAELAKTEATNAKNDNADSETNNNFSKKKEKGDNAKTKADNAIKKADEAKKILTEVQTEIKELKEHADKSNIALQKVLVGVFNEEMKPYLELSNKYADEANKKKTEAANQKAEMKALQTKYNDIPKETVHENIQKTIRTIDEVTKCAEKVLQTHSYIQYYEKEVEKGLEEIKKITDAANASTKKGSVEINVISLIQQETYAKNDSSKLTSAFEKMEKTKYEVISRMAAKRADLALSQTNTHMTNAAEQKKQASDALQSIVEMHQKLPKETSMGVLPKQKAAEDALRRINEETEKIGVSLQKVKQHKREVDDAFSSLSTEGVTVTAMGEKATMAENAATNAKTEALNAHNTHSILLEHTKKFENALFDCKVILAPLNSNEAVKKAQTHVNQMKEKERKVNDILLEIEKLQKTIPSNIQGQFESNLNNVKNNFKNVRQSLQEAKASLMEMEKYNKEVQKTADEMKTITDMAESKKKFQSMENIATKINQELTKTIKALQDVTLEEEEVTKTHIEIEKVLGSATEKVKNANQSAERKSDRIDGIYSNEKMNITSRSATPPDNAFIQHLGSSVLHVLIILVTAKIVM